MLFRTSQLVSRCVWRSKPIALRSGRPIRISLIPWSRTKNSVWRRMSGPQFSCSVRSARTMYLAVMCEFLTVPSSETVEASLLSDILTPSCVIEGRRLRGMHEYSTPMSPRAIVWVLSPIVADQRPFVPQRSSVPSADCRTTTLVLPAFFRLFA
jgi:hypothetical protein